MAVVPWHQLLLLFFMIIDAIESVTLFNISSGPNDFRYIQQTFECLDDDDCIFNCNAEGGFGSDFVLSAYTPIYCTRKTIAGSHGGIGGCSCSSVTCDQTGGAHNCDIHCNKVFSCAHNTIYCGNNSICNIYCDGGRACASMVIYCGDNSECNLFCRAGYSCYGAALHCGTKSNCSILCNAHDGNGGHQCEYLQIFASDSNSLNIDVYNDKFAAHGMIVYAPNIEETLGQQKTIINCGINTHNKSLSQYACDAIDIHSLNGWNDVQLNVNWLSVSNVFQDYTDATNTMKCGQNDRFFCYGYATRIEGTNHLMECHSDITICNKN